MFKAITASPEWPPVITQIPSVNRASIRQLQQEMCHRTPKHAGTSRFRPVHRRAVLLPTSQRSIEVKAFSLRASHTTSFSRVMSIGAAILLVVLVSSPLEHLT